MKSTLTIVLLCLQIYCLGQSLNVPIKRDTIEIDVEGQISQALLLNNKLYTFFVSDDRNSPYSLNRFYILTRSGIMEKEISLPEDIIHNTQIKIHYRNDSILLSNQFEENFYLDLNSSRWISIPNSEDFIYEDDRYYVTASCDGEWGGAIFFRDKTTSKIHKSNTTCPLIINKLNGKYYITNADYAYVSGGFASVASVVEIEDPSKMQVMDSHNDSFKWFPAEGERTIFYEYYTYISTSFVYLNELLHFNTTKEGTFISIVQDLKLEQRQPLGEKLYLDLQEQYSPNYQLLTFTTEQEDLFGLVEIKEGMINIHYLKNRNTSAYKRPESPNPFKKN